MDSILTSFPERLAFSRKRKDLTQGQLAEKIGSRSGKQTISGWERGQGEPSMSQLIRLAEELDTTIEWLALGNTTTQTSLSPEVQPGYTVIPTDEVITMQRALLQYKEKELQGK